MNPLVENILRRSKGQKTAIWLVTLLIIGFVLWQYFYAPGSKELSALEEKRDSFQAQISHEQRLAADLGRFRKELKVLQSKLDVALKQLPDKREIPGLLESVATLAKDSGLEILKFAPGSDGMKEFYAEVPVQVEMRGSFHQLATFFDEISGLSRVVNVSDVALTNPTGVEEGSDVRLDAKCNITTFRYLDPSERVSTDSSSDDLKKRRATKREKK